MAINSSKVDEEQKEVLKSATIRRLFSYLKNYKRQVAVVLVVLAVTIAISTVNPLLLEYAIDVNIAQKDWRGLVALCVFMVVINLVYAAGVRLRMLLMARITNNILLEIRDELYTHIQTLSFSFFDTRPAGKILARIIGDVNSLKDVLNDGVTKLIPNILTIIAILVIMMIKNIWLSLSAILVLPLIAVGMYFIQIVAHKRWQTFRKKSSNVTAYIHEDFSGIRIIKSFTAEQESQGEFDRLLLEHQNSFIHAVRLADGFSAVIEVTWGIGTFLLYFIGISVLGVDAVPIGTFTAFAMYLTMFWDPIQNLAGFYNKLITNLSAAERIFEILDTPAEVADKPGVTELPPIKGEVTFDHVSFAYSDDPDTLVLKDVSFTAAPGETIALVGPTGAGKTTIVNLISRFYDVTAGQILIDGHSISDVTLKSLRSQMGVMTQDTFLFTGTVRENICYGRGEATEEEMIAAAKAVNAHSFIMKMEKGYDTEISEHSSQLSIGQRQLLAFARTILSDPRILILDEATSSIDTHTERMVQEGIEAMIKGRTSFIIAHRLSTIRNADRIFYIDHQGIVEMGSHAELMKKRGAYYRLYRSQYDFLAEPAV